MLKRRHYREKTNYGVTQGCLDEYRSWHSSLKTEYNLPLNFLDGWYERTKLQYNDKDKFEEKYAQKRLKYFDKYFDLLREERTKRRLKKELEKSKK